MYLQTITSQLKCSGSEKRSRKDSVCILEGGKISGKCAAPLSQETEYALEALIAAAEWRNNT
jgi:hypothetical protein